MKKFRRIGILTSGGDAPGMNNAIRAITRAASRFTVFTRAIKASFTTI